ncbi:bifunctional UDP-N-acetylmuramoyl-tripeptide:D-alanyl-D-alanine ligase/alanine racemase [Thermophagus xiamenensis]|uniref:Alanine racemase n=1 Tax=Thermophagus xiamenensis TaxID=385682 RepID=A0A1I2AK18_9BACT|nr:bifunctional UDP-N-acetylmuramoyl-tripeptide:D-alanyl-D-alanine ligase/alanine racemase [Thermophagus xiamenensis]SFE43210.1 UDP-N-acetylmuramoyl-tripeptide--D-alanyl-D-alanine ligase [Thermophagus xiamenensis]
MIAYSIREIANVCGGKLLLNKESSISRLLWDSRSVYDASEGLFFALKGNRHDGHQFLYQLVDKGVGNFVVKEGKIPDGLRDKANWIEVQDVLLALQKVAAFHRQHFSAPVLAITGSNGKTIVKEWITQMIGNDRLVTRSPRSFNSQIGVPLSVWLLNDKTDIAIFEAGISQPGEMQRLEKIIRPDMGLFTTLGQAHQENFTSLDEKLHEKLHLFKDVKTLFYNADQLLVKDAVRQYFPEKNLLSWGRSKGVTLQLLEEHELDDKMRLELSYGGDVFYIEIPFSDKVSVANILPAVLFLLYLGYTPENIAKRTALLEPVAMRLELKEGTNRNLLINDTYNSDVTSLEMALDFLAQQSRKKGMSRTVILSDLLQTGLSDEELYPQVANMIKEKEIDRFIGVGDALMRHASLFDSNARFFETTDELLRELPSFRFSEEAILVKGSRSYSFERIVGQMELKRHATVMEVNLDALTHNLNQYRRILKPQTKVLAMVKAFSYGSGSYEIAAALQYQNIDYLGVAFADEGVELRRAGISVPIIVMNPEEKSFGQIIEYHLEPEIYNFRVLEAFNKAVAAENREEVPIHIKLDTGMHRMGFSEKELDELIFSLKQKPRLRIKSVFSHLAASDSQEHDGFTKMQIETFEKMCRKLKRGLNTNFWMHILNSAGIERFPEAQFDMVRLGIGLYGFGAGKIDSLRNVVTLKSFISQIKPVSAHETIGYNRAGTLNRDGRIGIVPIGYADGLNRHLSNGHGKMIVRGQQVPIVGNICMDMCMVDLTDVNAEEGDEVVVFGDDYPVTMLANQLDTIPYEILTGISRRVVRVYYRE